MKEVADLLLLCVALVFLIFASISDIKKKEIPNWLSISLLAIALAIRGIAALTMQEASYFYWALIAAAIVYGISELLYRGMVFGGGDFRILVALAAVFATKPYFVQESALGEPFLITFFINALFVGSLWGVFSAIVFFFKLGDKEKKDFSKEFKEISKRKDTRLLRILFFAAAFLFLVFAFIGEYYFLIISAILIIYPFLYVFIKVAEHKFLIKLVSPDKLTEGDWLAEPVKIGNKVLKKTSDGLTKQDIELIKKAKKEVYILEGIVFIPSILVGLLISLFVGNILFLIAQGILS